MPSSSFSDTFNPSAVGSAPIAREHEILHIAATLGGLDGSGEASTARREILKWASKRAGGQLPKAAWNEDDFDHPFGGRYCAAVRSVEEASDVWAIRADDPDKNIPQRAWRTEAIISHSPQSRVRLFVRLLVSSPEKRLIVAPAVPGFVKQLGSKCGLFREDERLEDKPWIVTSEEDATSLIDTLVNPKRRLPVMVFSVLENENDRKTPLIDPSTIASDTQGIAKIVVLPAQFTWNLTKRFGKRLSVYNGAIRIYLPGFTEDADPYGGHDLFLPERLSTHEQIMHVSARLRQLIATESLRQFRLHRDVVSYAVVRDYKLNKERNNLKDKEAGYAKQLAASELYIDALEKRLKEAKETHQWLSDEHSNAENHAKELRNRNKEYAYRIRQLQRQIKNQGGTVDGDIHPPSSWEEFAEWCEQHLVGRVKLSQRARREVSAPKFKNFKLAGRCLLWLANTYHDRRLEGGEGDLREQVESGVHNVPCGRDTFRFNWNGSNIDVKWHIKSGGNTHDPTRCLRIYYFWEDSAQRVVVASMPAHIRTDAT